MNDPRYNEKFYESKMPFAREKAAQVWGKTVDAKRVELIAEILVQEMYAPHLGCATTRELLEEITARIEVNGKLDYMTIMED